GDSHENRTTLRFVPGLGRSVLPRQTRQAHASCQQHARRLANVAAGKNQLSRLNYSCRHSAGGIGGASANQRLASLDARPRQFVPADDQRPDRLDKKSVSLGGGKRIYSAGNRIASGSGAELE